MTDRIESYRKDPTDCWHSELSKSEIALVERPAGPLIFELVFQPVTQSKLTLALAELRMAERARSKAGHLLWSRIGRD